MKSRTVLFLLVFLQVWVIYAQETRGFKPVAVNVEGKPTTLYQQSHALIIGISAYNNGWNVLNGVKADVAEVKKALEGHGFNVEVSQDGTKEQIDKAISTFISKYGQSADNRLLIYYAGHGYTVKTSYGDELGYIVPVNAPSPSKDLAGFQEKAIEMAQIEIYAKRIQSKHALFMFDACFAGSLFDMRSPVTEAITYKTTQQVRQFITSGSAEEQVPDVSIFRKQFVEALTTKEADYDKDGFVTGSELGQFLQTKVVNYSYNSQHPQYGKIRNPKLDKGDFVFELAKAETKQLPPPEEKLAAGSIKLTTELTGKFYIDGGFYSDVTAGTTYNFDNIVAGVHVLNISGTLNWTEKVMVSAGQTNTITARAETGTVELESELAGRLLIDNVFKINLGEKSTTFHKLTPGVHTLKIEGAQNWSENVFVIANKTTKVSAMKIVKTGDLNLISKINGKLYIDNIFRQQLKSGDNIDITGLSEGQHTAMVKDATTDKQLWQESFKITAGYISYLDAISSAVATPVNAPAANNPTGTFTDPRDGKVYKTVTIGTQTWMAENLNYKADNSCCYEESSSNCKKFGRLYFYQTSKNICPNGWRLPSKSEFETLLYNVGGAGKIANNALIEGGSSGFNALLGGFSNRGAFYDNGENGCWWSSTENNAADSWYLNLDNNQGAKIDYDARKELRRSVRCLKDNTAKSENTSGYKSYLDTISSAVATPVNTPAANSLTGTFTDPRDGKTYKTVKIGTQTWMAENLNYTGNNGFQKQITDKTKWENNKKYDGWCYYDNNSENGNKYGVLYQWEAARNACPSGWHLPSDKEWAVLINFTGESDSKRLRSKTGWIQNSNGNDSFGFNALPGGIRLYGYTSIGSIAYWWSSTESESMYAYSRNIDYNQKYVFRPNKDKAWGFSVRCLKDN